MEELLEISRSGYDGKKSAASGLPESRAIDPAKDIDQISAALGSCNVDLRS